MGETQEKEPSEDETYGELVVVTGMTGAGRSTAAKELEDLGYFVVDNLPPARVEDVVRMVDDSHGHEQSIAVVVDVRSGSFFDTLAGANRYAILYRVQDAKKPETRAARIAKFVEMCHNHETLH